MAVIPYPFTGGQRHSSASAEVKVTLPGQTPFVFTGWRNFGYTWELTPVDVKGPHPDPLGWTIGEAKYEGEIEVPLAEYNYYLSQAGQGFAVTQALWTVSYSENGFDTIVDELIGLRLVKGEGKMSNNADPLYRTMGLKMLKIKPNGVDLLLVALQGVQQGNIPSPPGVFPASQFGP